VRVAPHHLCALPSARLLQHVDRRAGLGVPRGPRVAQIMPPEVLQARLFDGLSPRLGVDLAHPVSLVR